ncbi:hypothetical protein QBZ16_002402 [Prototheca wickerhamii]|uniref:Uncharacterized protein n=1 Tax=Prototheca wickerhamii TaxID=3111 RepID=A0AAD9IPB8_PROWI|nr:hypothetical protein QBZ16_002402 [Prototheca wickerhamii]
MVVGRSATLRRDASMARPPPGGQNLNRALSVAIRARGDYNAHSVESMDRAVLLSGRQQLKQNVQFYGRYLAPEAVVTVIMFAVFAIISSLTIHVICLEDCKDSMGWRKDNVTTPKGSQVVWLLFWALQYSWLALFPLMIGRALFRSVPDLMYVCFMLYPALYSAVYGRFFLLQLDNVGSVFLINLMQSALQLAARLSDRASDDLWMAWLYVDELHMVELFTSSIAENGGIVAASALMSFGKVTLSPTQGPNHGSIWINAVGQLITGFIFDFVGLCVERKYHAFEWERVFPTSLRRVLKYVVVILVMGFSRLCVELLQLFCPQDTDEFGIVLRSCDKPSIFQAVNVAFAARNRGTTLGSFIDMNSTTTTF